VVAQRHHGADGGAHAGLVGVQLRHAKDEIRGCLDGTFEQPGACAQGFVGVDVEQVELGLVALDHAVDGVDRFTAGHLPRRMTAHSVRNHPQPQLVVTQERVLVDLPFLADVGGSAGVEFQPVSVHAFELELRGSTGPGDPSPPGDAPARETIRTF
jgi:hypothetical protein